jgi:hypothetical protein
VVIIIFKKNSDSLFLPLFPLLKTISLSVPQELMTLILLLLIQRERERKRKREREREKGGRGEEFCSVYA